MHYLALLGLRGERLSRKGTRSYSSEGRYISPVGRLCIFWVRNSCDGGRVLQLADLGIQEKINEPIGVEDIAIGGGDGVGFYSLFGTGAVVAGIVEPRAEASRLPLLG